MHFYVTKLECLYNTSNKIPLDFWYSSNNNNNSLKIQLVIVLGRRIIQVENSDWWETLNIVYASVFKHYTLHYRHTKYYTPFPLYLKRRVVRAVI